MSYKQSDLQNEIADSKKRATAITTVDMTVLMNKAVRYVLNDLDLRTTKRQVASSPNLFEDIYDYSWPADGKDLGFIDIEPQINRSKDNEWILTTPEEFDRKKSFEKNLVAIKDRDGIRKLRVSADIFINPLNNIQMDISTLDTLTSGGGTWSLYGDAINVVSDSDNFVKGAGSIKFDISGAGGTTAGIQNLSISWPRIVINIFK